MAMWSTPSSCSNDLSWPSPADTVVSIVQADPTTHQPGEPTLSEQTGLCVQLPNDGKGSRQKVYCVFKVVSK
jgi:hypothetical protein